jgi:hypothetical protein
MKANRPQGVVFLVIAVVCIISSVYATGFIWKHSTKGSLSSRLLLGLHITVFLEELTSLPFIFAVDNNLCKAFGFFHFYTGLANITVTCILTLHYCNHIFFSNVWLSTTIDRYFNIVSFCFPLITLLPFVTDSYHSTNANWCSLPSSNHIANEWSIAVFYSWVWFMLLGSLSLICYVMYRARLLDKSVSKKVFSSFGIYVFITVLCWLPRSAPRFVKLFYSFSVSDSAYMWTTIPLYLTGLFYCLCLWSDRTFLHIEDSNRTPSDELDVHFAWEDFDEIGDVRLSEIPPTLDDDNCKQQLSTQSPMQSDVEV